MSHRVHLETEERIVLDLNVTYNYSQFYHKELDADYGLRCLDGRIAAECIERLEAAVHALGTDKAENYWLATPGNAGYALSILLRWAKEHPDGRFRVS